MYKIINGAINRAILDYNCSKAAFITDNKLPTSATIPDLLAFDGQLLRSVMERAYHGHIMDNWKELQAMTSREMECRFNEVGKKLQEGNKLGGLTVPVEKLLTEEEMKAKKKSFVQARKRGLQASQGVSCIMQEGCKKKAKQSVIRFGAVACC